MKKVIDLSIIIPTLNEEHYIGKLIDSIYTQSVQPKEIVIVDAKSTDNTILEIKKRQKKMPQLHYFQIPKYTISRQRNLGVKKTKASHILFLDADMLFTEKDTLKDYYDEAVEKDADYAITRIQPLSKKRVDVVLYEITNTVPKIFKPIKAYATTMNFFIKRTIFEKVGGFDEEIKVAEDFELVSRLQKVHAKFEILKKPVVYNSVRRLEKEGRMNFVTILMFSLLFILLIGYKKNPIYKKYDFGNHPKLKT